MDDRKAVLLNEVRYAERLTQRTARLYRRLATAFTFLAILGGSSLTSKLSAKAPDWLALTGLVLLGIAGAAALSIRPLEKAITNEADAKKYAALRTAGVSMSAGELELALQKARESDTAEVESLRNVAYNDMVVEVGRSDLIIPLTRVQRFLSALA